MVDVTAMIARYRASLRRRGETIIVRRYTGTGENPPYTEAAALARVAGYDSDELVGGIVEGDRKIIVLGEDIASLLPLTNADHVIVRGRELAVIAVDDSTRRTAGVLIAVELRARG